LIERKFIEKGIRNVELSEYLDSVLDRADYSHSDIKRTPLNTRITVFAGRPSMVIGRGGIKIKEITKALSTQFKIDNPQIEVKSIENPDLDAQVIAKQIVSALEKGMKYRRIVNVMIKRIMSSGAAGVEVTVSGKLGGSRSRSEKFLRGYIKKCGDTAEKYTSIAYEAANLRQGVIGVRIIIMKSLPEMIQIQKKLKTNEEKVEEESKESDDDSSKTEKVDETPNTPKINEEKVDSTDDKKE